MSFKVGDLTFKATLAIAQHLRVKITSGTTTSPPEVELAGVGDVWTGTTLGATLVVNKSILVRPRNFVGTVEMMASGAISKGVHIYGAASGKISATANGDPIGVSIEAASADEAIIEILPYPNAGKSMGLSGLTTIATTSNTDEYVIAPLTGNLNEVDFSGIDALTAHDTNYITWSITNLGQSGSGSDAMLAATDANTTKATGGTALAANTKRVLTLHGTAANLEVVAGDRLRIRAAASGTLANTVTQPSYLLQFGA